MSDTHIVLVGTDVTARIAIDIFAAQNKIVLGILENDPGKEVREVNDISVFAPLHSEDARVVMSGDNVEYFVAVGENAARKEAYETMAEIAKKPASNAIHPAATVSPYANLDFGNLVNAGAVVGPNATLGSQNLVHAGAVIEPKSILGHYCHISAGAKVGGNVTLGDEVFVGTGAAIHPGVTVGRGSMIGAGSVVLRDVEEDAVVHGNPAVQVGTRD